MTDNKLKDIFRINGIFTKKSVDNYVGLHNDIRILISDKIGSTDNILEIVDEIIIKVYGAIK